MKIQIVILLLLLLFSISINAQSIKDTKDFIVEKVDANDPISSYDNAIFFNESILKTDANKLAGKILSESEFKHIFIYATDCYFDGTRKKWWLTTAHIIDVRDITKVSTTRNTGDDNYYIISVYIGHDYFATDYSKLANKDKPDHKYLSKMEIAISDNSIAAEKIKKAIIHLSHSYGGKAKDGDIF